MSSTNYSSLIEKLNEFIRKYYQNQLLRGVIYVTGMMLLAFIVLVIAEYFGHFNATVRTALFYSFMFTGAFLPWKYVFTPLLKLYKLSTTISYEESAQMIGQHFPDVQDKLLNVLQLQTQNNSLDSNEANLLEASIQQKTADLKPVPFTTAIDFSENKKYLKFLLIPIFIIGIATFSAPDLIGEGTQRIVQHREHFEIKAPFEFSIENEKLSAIAQEDFKLNVKLSGTEIPNEAYISIDGNEFLLKKETTVDLFYTFKNVQKTTSFQLVAEGFKSKVYELKVLPNPIVLNFDLKLTYPKYLNRKSEELKNTGDLTIPAGTKVEWIFFTKNTDALRMSFQDTSIALSGSSDNVFNYSKRFYRNQEYAISTANEYVKNNDSIRYVMNVKADEFPQIKVEEKGDSASFKSFYFKGEVMDDYGLKKLTFNYRFVSNNDSAVTDEFKQMTTNSKEISINKSSTRDRFYHFWNLNELGVEPGDQLEYYFEIWDNDGIRGSKSTKSQKKLLKTPTRDELDNKTDKTNEDIKKKLEESIRESKEVQKELSDLQRKVSEKQKLSWEEKQKMQALLKKQAELHKKVAELNKENKQNNQQQNEYKQQDEEIAQKQKQLEELFDKVLSPEMKEQYEEMQKLLEKLDKKKIQDALEKIKLDNKELMKELDRNLEIFKQLEVEKKLQESIDKLDKLAEKQKELSEKSADKKEKKDDLAAEQEKLNEEFEKLKEDLADMEKKNEELERPNKMEDTKKEQDEIQEEMKKSSEQLEKNKKDDASDSQKESAEKMQELSKSLSKMQESMQQQAQEENIDDLREILENLIQLSFNQEALMETLKNTTIKDPEFYKINREQKKLRDDAQMIEDSLFALSKRVPEIKPIVNKEISAINNSMDKVIYELGEAPTITFDRVNHKYEARGQQQFAMTAINNLALLLSEALDQMQQQAKSQKPGDGSCNKPGGKGPKSSAASLRKMQEALNKRIKDLKEGMGKPGGKGKEGKGQGMSKELAQMAAQQEAIRREVQKISNELKKEGKGGSGMNKMLEEMEKTETDLVNKVINQETINRQEEILSRLLESEKAEKEREQDQKRQSSESKNEIFGNPTEFLEYKKQRRQETELLKTVPPALNPFFKEKVKQYFMNFEE